MLDEPEKWAPVLANQLADRTEYLRSEALKGYGIDLFKDPDEWPPHMKGSSSVRKPRDLMLMITEVALLIETGTAAAIDSLDLLDCPPERDRRLCEWVIMSWYAVPMVHAQMWWSLVDPSPLGRTAKEILTAHLAGFLATKQSLTVNKRLRALLKSGGGSHFSNLLEHLLTEAFGLWAEHDPRHQNADDLVREAARRIEEHLAGEALTNLRDAVPDAFKDPTDAIDQFEEFIARETARTEVALYRAARQRANLARRQREALDLREAGLSEKEIAARMGITPGAVKSHLSRARKKVLADMYRED